MESEVEDDIEDEYIEHLFRAAKRLDELVGKCKTGDGEAVYVYDTNGATSAPTLVVVYLALFIKHPDWQDVYALQ